MISDEQQREYYNLLGSKDPELVGKFYVGVKTTGIFCRTGCPARQPKFENCMFFETTDQAVDAGFRPCKRCRPLL
jgi:AraC family transcriptional regulator of adaptative response/methylated-DNA-[protein]-cysteine methyltransferase